MSESDRPVSQVWRARTQRADTSFDVGLQHERTALAWDRTALSMVVAGGVLTHAGGSPYLDLKHLPAYVVIGFGAFLMFWASRRYDVREETLRESGEVLRPRLIRVVGIVSILLSVSALAVTANALRRTVS